MFYSYVAVVRQEYGGYNGGYFRLRQKWILIQEIDTQIKHIRVSGQFEVRGAEQCKIQG
jgi:hypothetical protein